MNRLAPGTVCADCLCCEAVTMVMKEPLCRSCRMGFPLCEKKRKAGIAPPPKVDPLPTRRDADEAEDDSWRERSSVLDGPPKLKKPRVMPKSKWGLAPEVIAAIQAESFALTDLYLAKKYGVSNVTIARHRGSRRQQLAGAAKGTQDCPMCGPDCVGGAHRHALREDGITTREQYEALENPAASTAEVCRVKRREEPASALIEEPPAEQARLDEAVKTVQRQGKGIKTSEEIRAAILAEPLMMRTDDVAKKYGLSYSTTHAIRRKAGRSMALEARKRRSDFGHMHTRKPSAEEQSHVKQTEADMEKAIEAQETQPQPQPESLETVTLHFSPEQLDAIWGKLSTDVKAIAIQGVLQAWV
jgi:response regulator of citrate/malate metabolism